MHPTIAPETAPIEAVLEAPGGSTGPRTPQGKAISKLNSLKHGLTGGFTLVTGEDPDEYNAHLEGFFSSYQPMTAVENHIVTAIAQDSWRIERLRLLEGAHLAEAIENCCEPDEKRLNLYSLYESRITRNLQSNRAELRRLIAERDSNAMRELHRLTAPPIRHLEYAPAPEPQIAEDSTPADTLKFVFSDGVLDLSHLPESVRQSLPEDFEDRFKAKLAARAAEIAA